MPLLATPLFTASLTALRALPLALVQTALHAAPGRAARCVTHQARQALRQACSRAGDPHAPSRARHAAWLALLGLLAALPVRAWGQAAADPTAPVVESPYFFVRGAQPGVDALPLKRTDVRVNVAGVVAEVVVTQHYRNEGAVPIEARYIFPGGTRAAVHGLNVRVGDRVVAAHIREKQQARAEYDAARQAGQTAALLEQHRPNVFQMHVANILPGDDVQVELRYNELLTPRQGRYQFVFPTVVGPRYAGTAAPDTLAAPAHPAHLARAFPAQPVLRGGEPGASAFQLTAHIHSPIGVQEVRSPSHAIDTRHTQEGDGRQVQVQLAEHASRGQAQAGNRDFILDWTLAGSALQSGVLLQRGEKENFFLAMVEPPRAAPAQAITPREYVFVVDVSGSMHGFPLDTTRALMRALLGGLRPGDQFNVLLFSGSSRFLAPEPVPATAANVEAAIATLAQTTGGGGTELLPALRRVYASPKRADLSRTIVVVTDGYVTVEDEAFALVRRHLGQANLFAFGIGSAVNRHLVEGLARAGMGEPFVITRPDEAAAQAARFARLVAAPVLTSVQARFEGLEVYDVEPQTLPDVLAERPLILFGKWREPPAGAQPRLVLQGHSASGPWQQTLPVNVADAPHTAALRFLWARHRIAALNDQEALTGDGAQRAAITRLGLDYSLLTAYTSFVAVDRVLRHPGGPAARADQPSPLPEGVSEHAVGETLLPATALGHAVASTPEPAAWAAMLLVLAVLGAQAARRRGTWTG